MCPSGNTLFTNSSSKHPLTNSQVMHINEAYKCRKLTDLFGSSAATSTISSSLEQVQDDEENDEGASSDIQPASCVHDEGQS